MTKFISLAFASLFLIGVSCSKEDDNTTPSTSTKPHQLPGLWIGTHTADQFPQQPPLPYNFVIKPDGTVLTEGKVSNGNTYYSRGTWTLTGDTLRLTYTTINFPNATVTQSAKFFYNSKEGTLTSGTWRDEQNGSNYTGKFQNMIDVEQQTVYSVIQNLANLQVQSFARLQIRNVSTVAGFELAAKNESGIFCNARISNALLPVFQQFTSPYDFNMKNRYVDLYPGARYLSRVIIVELPLTISVRIYRTI